MVYRLHLVRDPDGTVHLRLGWGWRVFFTIVTIVLVAAMVQDGSPRGILPLLALISLFASLYHESWQFDRRDDTVTGRTGVLFYAPVRRYRLSTLRAVRVRSSAPAVTTVLPERTSLLRVTPRGFVQLILDFEAESGSSTSAVIQTDSLRQRDSVEALARDLSDAIGVPLEMA